MTLTFVAGTAWTTGATSVATSLPAGVTTGDQQALAVATKRTGAPTTPTGWTLAASTAGLGGGVEGAGTGPVYLYLYSRIYDGTNATPTVARTGTGAVMTAKQFAYRCGAGETVEFTATSGADATSDATWSVTGAAVLPLTAGDDLVALGAVTNTNPTVTGHTLAAAGATLGATVAVGSGIQQGTTSGDDIVSMLVRAPVTAGTATGAPTLTGAVSNVISATGGALLVRAAAQTGGGATSVTGAGALTAAAPTLSGAGAVTSPTVTGAGALAAAAPTLSGAGAVRVTGSGTLSADAAALAGDGVVRATGAGALAAPAPTLSGAGTLRIAGAGELAALAGTLAATALVTDPRLFRDITVTTGPLTSRALTAAAQTRRLTGTTRIRTLAGRVVG